MFSRKKYVGTAKITGLPPEQVRIHTTFLGGAFGRRATPTSDFVSEAVHVAKAAGAPVKTVWSREDDIRGGYYRPMYVQQARIGVDAQGRPVAWHHVLVGQSILAGSPFEAAMVKNGIDATSVEGVADSPYFKEIPDHRVELHSPKTGIPVLWWRSVGHSHTAFVMESLIDELAHAAGQDPVGYRRALLEKHPRHLAALNLAYQLPADLILMGTHGPTSAQHVSHTDRVLTQSPCPVLTMRDSSSGDLRFPSLAAIDTAELQPNYDIKWDYHKENQLWHKVSQK